MENIRYGRLEASEQEVRRAAEAVSADTVVNKLEQGYDSPVGEGGDRLSTGEKQLISFARAVLADPRIFVLDEAPPRSTLRPSSLFKMPSPACWRGGLPSSSPTGCPLSDTRM
jgi:ATP-binding cassette subfamily B protein